MAFDKVAYLAAAKKKLDAASALMSASDRDEQEGRAEAAAILEAAEREERNARDLDLARRFDIALEAVGDAKQLRTVVPASYPDSFIMMRDAKSHTKFQKALEQSRANSKIDMPQEKRDYIVGSVFDWNGETDFDATSLNGPKLRAYLEKNSGITMLLVESLLAINGVIAEERKS